MTISPVSFVASPPIRAIERVERVKRRAKSKWDDEETEILSESRAEPMFAASSPEEVASDATRDGLLKIRLGG
jgi:hypothetical protein